MILWLSSYPKSGNTWVRIFLSTLIYSRNNIVNFEDLSRLRTFPKMRDFNGLCENVQDRDELIKKWITAQEALNLNTDIKIFKTHNVMCNVKGHNFSNLENSLGVIYVVRDPRNVLSSIMNHFSISDQNEAKNFIQNDYNWIGLTKNGAKKVTEIPIYIGSWGFHYNSWKVLPKNYLLIKYENLLSDPEKEFFKIYEFIKKFIKIDKEKKIVKKIIDQTSFVNLQEQENKNLFTENVFDLKSKKKIKFFNLGPRNNWKHMIDEKISQEIQNTFKKEMSELGYL